MNRRRFAIVSCSAVAALLPALPAHAASSGQPSAATPSPSELTIAPVPNNVEKVKPLAVMLPAIKSRSNSDTKRVQDRLNALGFWNSGSGNYDWSTQQAVLAFQKYIGLPRTGSVNHDTAAYLSNFDQRAHAAANYGDLVEVDKRRQLLFIVRNGRTLFAFNTSTGKGIPYTARNKKDPTKIEKGDAKTPVGLFETTHQRKNGWWEGDLGKIYRPKYFVGGIAIHGMTSVPAYPASHGCVRLSIPAMDFIWAYALIPLHTVVWVHD